MSIVWLTKRFFDTLQPDLNSIVLMLEAILLLSPVGFMQMAYDIGRPDHLNYLLVLIAALLGLKQKLFFASLVIAVGILIHEGIFFYGLPIVLMAATVSGFSIGRIATLVALPCIAIAAVVLFGNADPELLAKLPGAITGSVHVWSRGVLEPNLELDAENWMLLVLYVTLPFALCISVLAANRLPILRYTAPMAGVLVLFLLGGDYFRWSHLLFVSFF